MGRARRVLVNPRHDRLLPRVRDAPADLLVGLARHGRDIAEIAGNHQILVTVLAPAGPLPPLDGARELFEVPIQSRAARRRVGLDVSVEHLGSVIRAMENTGATVEHVYEY